MSRNKLQPCVVCTVNKTPNVFNINFKAVPVCEKCAKLIFIQQATWYTQSLFVDKPTLEESKKITDDKVSVLVEMVNSNGETVKRLMSRGLAKHWNLKIVKD